MKRILLPLWSNNASARHILMSRLPIVKIAALCNFGDIAYLGRLFRRRYGMTMREYRAQGRTA